MFGLGGGEGVVLELTFMRLSQIMNFFFLFPNSACFPEHERIPGKIVCMQLLS